MFNEVLVCHLEHLVHEAVNLWSDDAVADQDVGGIKSCFVEHWEIRILENIQLLDEL